jgi:hypothetical protein
MESLIVYAAIVSKNLSDPSCRFLSEGFYFERTDGVVVRSSKRYRLRLFIGKPMIRKIISGGQTGADRAALDAAIKLGIPHGGWIPKGRKTENGRLPDKYELKEMATGSYPKRTEKNVVDSDGTLIISHGTLTGGSALTRDYAEKHQRTWLHIDLDTTPASKAASLINSWIIKSGIEILNVAGSRASEDQSIYKATFKVLESVFI